MPTPNQAICEPISALSSESSSHQLPSSETAYLYLAAHLSSLPSGSPQSAPSALKTIAAAVQLSTIFNFDALLKIDAVHAVKDHPLYHLLKIYLNHGLDEYLTWENANAQVVEEFCELLLASISVSSHR